MTTDTDSTLFGKQPLAPGEGANAYPDAPATRRAKPVVYLAGPVDRVDDAPELIAQKYRADRATIRNMLAVDGFAVYAPHVAWAGVNLQKDACPAVAEVNDRALVVADALIALLPAHIPTSGTYDEVEQAAQDGIPTVVVAPDSAPWSGRPAGTIRVGTIEEALNTVNAWRDRGLLGTRGKPTTVRHDDLPDQTEELAQRDLELAENEPLERLPFTVSEGIGNWALPTRHYADDVGLDLWVTENRITIEPGRFADVPSGVQVQLPVGTWGLVIGRSSAVRKRGIFVVPGVIDVGYRGDLFVGCYNVGEHPQTLAQGDRIGQFIVLPNLTQHYQPVVVDELEPSLRGTSGFGSTGGISNGHGG